MSDLTEALACLGPIDYVDVPVSDLSSFLQKAFKNAEIVVNSIPPSSSTSSDPTSESPANSAKKATDTIASGTPTAIDERNASYHKGWGKPYNMKEKDNPLHVAVYKMSAHDKHGAWFARRSIHQGLGFEKWKHAMQKEFAESVKVQGGPGAGAIRGIGADRRVKHEVVEGVGEAAGDILRDVYGCVGSWLTWWHAVWQLSANFGPVTPREFLMLVMTSEHALSDASALDESSGKPPRHWMVVSRPTSHEDAPARQHLVKGQYESIEMIRELPRSGKEGDSEANPIEWIMITRSDPGGGIPKFMIERGTPGSVVGDTVKFLDWACKQDDTEDRDEKKEEADLEKHNPKPAAQQAEVQASPSVGVAQQDTSTPPVTSAIEPAADTEEAGIAGGLLSTVANAATFVGATASAYIPYLHSREDPEDDEDDDATSESSVVSSDEEFRSADEGDSVSASSSPSATVKHQPPVHQTQQQEIMNRRRNISAVSDAPSNTSSTATKQSITAELVNGQEPQNHHEKELLKIHHKRAQLEEKTAKARESEEQKAREIDTAEVKNAGKVKEKLEKEKRKREEKYEKEARKLEEKRLKEERKAEEKRRKAEEKDEGVKARRERDEAREKAALAEQEVVLLKKQLEELRHEHATLLAKMEGAAGE